MPTQSGKPLTIGAKFLGAMLLANFCARCFWYRLHCGDAPFSIFPSIFNAIDLYTKRVVHNYIDQHGQTPKWMWPFAKDLRYSDIKGFLTYYDEASDIVLKGAPDLVLHSKNEEHWAVGDYKTARYGNGSDHLLAQYKIQLLGYQYLLKRNGYGTPEKAALLYFQPPVAKDASADDLSAQVTATGFDLPLSVEVVPVELGDLKTIPALLKKARGIYDNETSPDGREGCRDCMRIDRYLRQAENDKRPRQTPVADMLRMPNGTVMRWVSWVEADAAILDEATSLWHPDWAEDRSDDVWSD